MSVVYNDLNDVQTATGGLYALLRCIYEAIERCFSSPEEPKRITGGDRNG